MAVVDVAAAAGVADESLTASRAAATDVSVAALTVASTNALIAAGSMAEGGAVASKNGPSGAVGDGVGVLAALPLILACGDGYRKDEGS